MDNTHKKYYTIGEVATLFNVSTSLVRYWEKRFPQLTPQKTEKGIRKYTYNDLKQFKIIYEFVKKEGYTLTGAQKALKVLPKESSFKGTIQKLKEIKSFLKLLQENL